MQAVSAELRALAGAVAFLTRVPVGRWIVLGGDDVSRAGAAFPFVGAGIGAVVGGLADALSGPLTAPVAAVCGVAAGTVVTGALHLDGLADTCDALGATSRERALEIMRDHRVGAYGAIALVLDLALKIAAVAALAARGDALRFAVCATAVARVAPVVLAAGLPYARTGGGTGDVLGSRARAAAAAVVAGAFCVWLGAAALLVVAGVAMLVVGLAAKAWLGGRTGDVLGASAEVVELACFVAAVAVA
jgi:adenosylcobinamide-GDP ribazoletransferase